MDHAALHLEIRNALSVSDELSRCEHALGDHDLAGRLSALRSALANLERDVGRSHDGPVEPQPWVVEAVERGLHALLMRRNDVPRSLRGRTDELVASAERVSVGLWDHEARVPSKPLAFMQPIATLPIARVIPQDVRSMLDYVYSAAFLASAKLARTRRGRAVGLGLGVGTFGASMVTDHRLSVAKVLPIEAHETLDYATGISAILAPFVLGYVKKDPIAALLHIGLGVSTIATALFTDYRATKGISWPNRSRGGPRGPQE